MEENIIVFRQRAANLGRLSIITAITMLPVMTHGCLNAYLTVALPKFQQSNSSGIVLDFRQVSWIGRFPTKKLRFLILSTNTFQWVWTNLPGWLVWWWLDLFLRGWVGRRLSLSAVSSRYWLPLLSLSATPSSPSWWLWPSWEDLIRWSSTLHLHFCLRFLWSGKL